METEVSELAEVNQIRLDEDLSVAQLADQIGIDTSTLHRLLFSPGRKPYDRTLHKIRRFLDGRNSRKRTGRRRASA
jgi:DNA-binding Xre family transcriptional regulator